MKKVIFTIIFLTLGICLFGQVIGSYTASQKISNEYKDVELFALYDDKYDQIYLYVDGTNREVFLTIGLTERYEFLFAFIKFDQWCHKCDSAKIFTSKVIETWDIKGGFHYGSELFLFNPVKIEYGILTTEDSNGNAKCSFYISVPELTANKNEYIKIPSRIIYVDSENVKKLRMLVSEDNVKKLKDDKKKIDDILK